MIPGIERGKAAGPDVQSRKGCNGGPDIIVPLLRAGVLARDFCRHGRQAEIEAVFDRSMYLRSDEMFVCVGNTQIGNGPLTLTADFGAALRLGDLGARPGQPVFISERRIAIGNAVSLTFERCKSWRQPRWPLPRSRRELDDLHSVVSRQVALEAPAEGLGRLFRVQTKNVTEAPFARIARRRIDRFETWLLHELTGHSAPITGSCSPVTDMIGLGPGLTPSGDDFLAGALALLDALAERQAHAALARAIAGLPRGSTSPLSECLLKAAAAGHIGENLGRAVSALIAGMPDRAVAAIRKIGHSSGWDMMIGILTALHAVILRDTGWVEAAWSGGRI